MDAAWSDTTRKPEESARDQRSPCLTLWRRANQPGQYLINGLLDRLGIGNYYLRPLRVRRFRTRAIGMRLRRQRIVIEFLPYTFDGADEQQADLRSA